jgi:hypothetical protein
MVAASRESFLDGGGELGNLIRNKDWDKTPLGSPGNLCLFGGALN